MRKSPDGPEMEFRAVQSRCVRRPDLLMDLKKRAASHLKSGTAVVVLFMTATFVLVPEPPFVGAASSPTDRSTRSQPIYLKNCAECHGKDGRARTAKGKRLGATDFTGSDWNNDGARGIRIINNGKGEMPSFRGKLKASEIRSVWNYVLSFRK